MMLPAVFEPPVPATGAPPEVGFGLGLGLQLNGRGIRRVEAIGASCRLVIHCSRAGPARRAIDRARGAPRRRNATRGSPSNGIASIWMQSHTSDTIGNAHRRGNESRTSVPRMCATRRSSSGERGTTSGGRRPGSRHAVEREESLPLLDAPSVPQGFRFGLGARAVIRKEQPLTTRRTVVLGRSGRPEPVGMNPRRIGAAGHEKGSENGKRLRNGGLAQCAPRALRHVARPGRVHGAGVPSHVIRAAVRPARTKSGRPERTKNQTHRSVRTVLAHGLY